MIHNFIRYLIVIVFSIDGSSSFSSQHIANITTSADRGSTVTMVDRSNALAAADRGSTFAVADRHGESKAVQPGSSGASVAADSTNRRAGLEGEEQEDSDGTMTEEKGQRDEREEERAPPGM
jgi:hypothetical protein